MTTPVPSNPLLERQASLNLHLPQRVVIVGCGGVGSWCAVFLALAGVPELELYDADVVSLTNLNRLPLGPGYVDLNKASALAHMLGQLTPQCRVSANSLNWAPAGPSLGPAPSWIIAATDSHASRVAIHDWATHCEACHEEGCGCAITPHEPRCRYLEVSADGEYGGCTDSPALFTSELELQRGYQSVPVWVGPCVSAATMACAVIMHPAHPATYNYRLGFNSETHKLELQSL